MILDLFKLDGKVAVVTGANTGLGQGMAVALAEAGAKVVGVGRRSCAETKEKIEAFGGSFTEVLADLSTTAAVDLPVFVGQGRGSFLFLVLRHSRSVSENG